MVSDRKQSRQTGLQKALGELVWDGTGGMKQMDRGFCFVVGTKVEENDASFWSNQREVNGMNRREVEEERRETRMDEEEEEKKEGMCLGTSLKEGKGSKEDFVRE